MKFKINGAEWKILDVDEATINNETKNDYCFGVTIYKTQTIMLLKDQANITKTLMHELMHAWLYEYAHPQNDRTSYDYEDVCEIVASSNNFINEIVRQYSEYEEHTFYADDEKLKEQRKKQVSDEYKPKYK